MNTQPTKLQSVENELKQLMAEVARAMEKAQDALARIAPKTAIAPVELEVHDFVALERLVMCGKRRLTSDRKMRSPAGQGADADRKIVSGRCPVYP